LRRINRAVQNVYTKLSHRNLEVDCRGKNRVLLNEVAMPRLLVSQRTLLIRAAERVQKGDLPLKVADFTCNPGQQV
jgi:hypothetical protein